MNSSVIFSRNGPSLWFQQTDILTIKHVSRIIGHCDNPALPFCPVCGPVISSCSMLKYWLENEKQEVLGCCNVRESYWRALERGYLLTNGVFRAYAPLARRMVIGRAGGRSVVVVVSRSSLSFRFLSFGRRAKCGGRGLSDTKETRVASPLTWFTYPLLATLWSWSGIQASSTDTTGCSIRSQI